MTNQVNQDAFEKWWYETDADLILSSRNSAEAGYQAATQARESEINSLKHQVNVLEKALANQSIEIAHDIVTIESYSHKVTALLSDNERLREALEDLAEFSNNRERIDKLLSSTPTQSLAEHDNEVTAHIGSDKYGM